MPVTHLSDFPDRFSPMLVKELRQGLRAKTFVGVFLALQIFLGVMLLSAGASSTSDHVGSVVSGIIFTFFAIAVLVIQPLRGIAALSAEVKGNTIDMMVLTRLSAWRIVFGKWVAIVSQSALLLSTIIPYLILRYFFGGMNLFAEMMFLLLLFATSMTLTAVTVGLSGCSSVIVRSLLPILGLPILLWSLLVMSLTGAMRGSTGLMDAFTLASPESRIGVACYLAAMLYLGCSMLSLGASLIAPAAENHSLFRRIAALLLIAALFAVGLLTSIEIGLLVTLVAVVGIPSIILALTDNSLLVPTVTEPFVSRGPVARAAGCFLYPTWASGVLFSILISAVATAAIFSGHSGSGWDADEAVVFLAFLGGLFFPAVWQAFLFRGEGQRFAHYLLLLAGSVVLLGILSALSESMDNGIFLWFFAWNPLVFMPMLNQSGAADSTLLLGVIIVDLVLMLILLAAALRQMASQSPVLHAPAETTESAG